MERDKNLKILAIETSSPNCSVAILDDDNIIKELFIDNPKTHSEKLMPLIKEVLDTSNISLQSIDLLVCGIGPGSFTGVRIGIATIKAFSFALNIPAVGVQSEEGKLAGELGKIGFSLYKQGIVNNLKAIYKPSYVESLPNGTN